MSFVYEFEWDRSKASANLTKHAVDFKLAATVFKDPLAATIFDGDHSGHHFGAPPNQSGNHPVRRDISMKPEYDFKNAERGKFFRPGAVLRLPIYLEPEVPDYLAAKAQAKNIDLDDLVNDLLKQEIRIAESLR